MSKRILTNKTCKPILRNADPIQEGTNFNLMRTYGTKMFFGTYAVIIADDNTFEGL